MIGALLGQWQRLTIYGLLAASLLGAVWMHGYGRGRLQLYDYQAKQAQQTVRIITKQAQATETIRVVYRDRIKRVEVQGEKIVERIPYIVPAGRRLSNGFVRIHDAAADGTIPEPATGTDGADSAVAEARAAAVIAGNYRECRADKERLTAWQEWALEQIRIEKNKN